MHPYLRNFLAILAGLLIGSAVNMLLVNLGHRMFPLPNGLNSQNEPEFKEAFKYFEPRHFLMPFLAHALGTLVGAFVAAKIAASHKLLFALLIGGVFLVGGILMVRMVPSPLWFTFLDLMVAYLPMAYLGGLLAGVKKLSPA